jgi:non-specific serine/threonine protein kinase
MLREDIGAPLTPAERALLEPYITAARSRLGEEAWEAACTEGRAMPPEEAVEYALSKEGYAPPTAPASEKPSTDEPTAALTRREKEVASLVARRLTNRQIASELFLSERTVDYHVANIFKKLNLHSREQVASRLAGQRPDRLDLR